MKVISNLSAKRIIILSFLLIIYISIVFSSELKQINFDHIFTISFNKEYKYKNNYIVLSSPKNSLGNDFDFQWTINEKGNIYIFKNLNKFNNTEITAYKIDILENTVKMIKLNTLIPAPFPPWIDILDVYAKNDKIYFLTFGGIIVFNQNFRFIDFYIFEDVANSITEKTKNEYENGVYFIPYNHGNQIIIDNNENIIIRDICGVKIYSYSGRNEKIFGGKIYSLSNKYSLNAKDNECPLLLEKDNGEIFIALFKEPNLKEDYIFNKIEIFNLNDEKSFELKMKNRKFYPTAALLKNYLYVLTMASNGSNSYLQSLKIKMNDDKTLFKINEEKNNTYYRFNDIKVKKVFNNKYIFIRSYDKLEVFKEF
ncbi:hypothetical protein [Marinitoga aeolica]|uniref:Uncharacterized protein n=1 Tax=Marinitoga aeolica TaxID=2809031 RepID=A0ABY8PSU1_9BACT|nr:hypothetical protein [Marinitoga aeolica]WGS65687.1 hypothetical protein JRV97_03805 [Marinitoga aeolica]